MIEYFLLMKIEIKEFDFFIELGSENDIFLPAHPNKTDILWIDGYFCEIYEILFDCNCGEYVPRVWLKLTVTDSMHYKDKDDAIKRLNSDYKSMKEYGWYINDYSHKEIIEGIEL